LQETIQLDLPPAEWTHVIRPKRGWFEFSFKELWGYRDLVSMFIRRDFVAVYKQTVLGPLWYLINPLASSLVFTVVFGKIARIPTDGVPPFLFYLSGITCWNYLATCVSGTASSFLTNSSLFGKVYFPRLISPVSTVISNLTAFSIQFLFLLLFVGVYAAQGMTVQPTWTMLLIPALILQIGLLGLGIGIMVSAATVKYRDFHFLVGFGIQLWMYASPIIYPASEVPARFRGLYSLNPIAPIIEAFRHCMIGTALPAAGSLMVSWLVTLSILFFGVLLFNRAEKNFMDVV